MCRDGLRGLCSNMNTIATFRLCTLNDKELLEKVREVAEKRGISKFDLIPVPCLLLPIKEKGA